MRYTDDMQKIPKTYRDDIPLENYFQFSKLEEQGLYQGTFYAFNTVITFLAPVDARLTATTNNQSQAQLVPPSGDKNSETHRANQEGKDNPTRPVNDKKEGAPLVAQEEQTLRQIFEEARSRCRFFERAFSRTLPHSDIARINAAAGSGVEISRETFDLLKASLHYCEQSERRFDITMGSVTKLWDFHRETMPSESEAKSAVSHVDWRKIDLWREPKTNEAAGRNRGMGETLQMRHFAKLQDPRATLDVGGTAKGYIADSLASNFLAKGLESFVINLGGNVIAHGLKPNGEPWKIGLQDPRMRHEDGSHIVGALPVVNASVVTSGIYERRFKKNGVTYHHILDTKTGFPVETDVAGVSVVAKRAMDAEGYSTTLLALGLEAGKAFVETKREIIAAYFTDKNGRVYAVENRPSTSNRSELFPPLANAQNLHPKRADVQ